MHPVMRIRQTIVDKKPQYELILSRANFNHLCAGCPSLDRLAGYSDNGLMFYIFDNPSGGMPSSFRTLPNKDGYYAHVGASVPKTLQGVKDEEFWELTKQSYETLEKAINESGRIPIEEETEMGKINLGYVVMRVEKDNL